MFPPQPDILAREKLGEGAYSACWRALYVKENHRRPVVVRYFPCIKSLHDFGREKEIYRKGVKKGLKSIPRLLEVRKTGSGYLQLFEDAHGRDLRKWLKQRKGEPWPEKTIVDAMTQIATTLMTLNSWGVIHSDIKPANILMNAQGRIQLLDLTECNRPGSWYHWEHYVGDKKYAPPERMDGHLDEQGQVFMLGLVAWEMATGRHLFEGMDDDTPFLNMVKLRWWPRDRSAIAHLSPWLQHLLLAMSSVDPNQRPTLRHVLKIIEQQVVLDVWRYEENRPQVFAEDELDARTRLAEAGICYARFMEAVDIENAGEVAEAKKRYAMLAEQGYSRAQNNLGVLLLDVGKVEAAVSLFRKALAKGNVYAAFNLGKYVQEAGDLASALRYFEFSAMRGHPQAKEHLSRLLEKKGRYAAAAYWKSLADCA
ncbi:Serine/threonine protein kinase [Sulfurivirga caldicuralii]|uniref:Serine/threonine protein kinase n=1 Tax=Sulfurivirga caldicuralii TaxID=364032 RepID=A0A1N6DBF9_9GAMM|nr:protein kinase [Sulfurivirga caldicuralii]SIN68023.1 Serine/threonine protein kinase [Sulfurivirga caldicuralii]